MSSETWTELEVFLCSSCGGMQSVSEPRAFAGVAAKVSAWSLVCGQTFKAGKVGGRGSLQGAQGVRRAAAVYHAMSAEEKDSLIREAKRQRTVKLARQQTQDPLQQFTVPEDVGEALAAEDMEMGPWKLSCERAPLSMSRTARFLGDKPGLKSLSVAWAAKSGTLVTADAKFPGPVSYPKICQEGCCASAGSELSNNIKISVHESLETIIAPRGARSLVADRHPLLAIVSSADASIFLRLLSCRKNPFTAEFLLLGPVGSAHPPHLKVEFKELLMESGVQVF